MLLRKELFCPMTKTKEDKKGHKGLAVHVDKMGMQYQRLGKFNTVLGAMLRHTTVREQRA